MVVTLLTDGYFLTRPPEDRFEWKYHRVSVWDLTTVCKQLLSPHRTGDHETDGDALHESG